MTIGTHHSTLRRRHPRSTPPHLALSVTEPRCMPGGARYHLSAYARPRQFHRRNYIAPIDHSSHRRYWLCRRGRVVTAADPRSETTGFQPHLRHSVFSLRFHSLPPSSPYSSSSSFHPPPPTRRLPLVAAVISISTLFAATFLHLRSVPPQLAGADLTLPPTIHHRHTHFHPTSLSSWRWPI